MGMELIGHRLSGADLQALLDDPSTVEKILYGELDDDDAEMPEPELDLDKSWHAVHFLLTGTAWGIGDDPAGAAVLGGMEIGEDGGYGPPRYLVPDDVRAVSAALDRLGDDTLRARFDPAALDAADIYPAGWSGTDVEGLLVHLAELRAFYRAAAGNGEGVLLALC
ncbi:YfbM family protein [Actinoplanes sp. NPDC023714]|uniref:YfbM family protein n=1 Tax=Actinoplanes sp. NPDC023714 TaxID=3154322 RepID=UPI0033F5B0FA